MMVKRSLTNSEARPLTDVDASFNIFYKRLLSDSACNEPYNKIFHQGDYEQIVENHK
jgi:hypothetical protein